MHRYPTFEKANLITKITIFKYAQRLLKPLNMVYKTMLILNFLSLIVFYLIDIRTIKEFVGFGFFYMIIWVLIPCLLLSITLYIYNKNNLIFKNLELKKHSKIVMLSFLSFVIVIINGFLWVNLN